MHWAGIKPEPQTQSVVFDDLGVRLDLQLCSPRKSYRGALNSTWIINAFIAFIIQNMLI